MIARAEGSPRQAARGWLRALSLAAAGTVSLALMLDPFLLSGIPSVRMHAALPLMMFGATGLFVYGFGFEPRTRILRLMFHPAVAWALFAIGLAAIAI